MIEDEFVIVFFFDFWTCSRGRGGVAPSAGPLLDRLKAGSKLKIDGLESKSQITTIFTV